MKFSKLFLLGMTLPLLASCGEVIAFKAASAGLLAVSQGVFSDPDVNLKEKNYAAADFLVGQVSKILKPTQMIDVRPLEEVDHAGITSPLGHKIPEGVGLRFAELGYSVDLHRVATEGNAGLYKRSGKAALYALSGTYAVRGKQVHVYLRLVSNKTGQVIGQFDYMMPMSSELRQLAQTQTRIYIVE